MVLSLLMNRWEDEKRSLKLKVMDFIKFEAEVV